MYTGPERGRFHEWAQQKRSRRSILRGISEVVLAVSAVGTVGYVAIQAMRGSEVLKGEPTTGEIKKYVTKMNGFNPPLLKDPVPVRRPDGPIELRTGVLAGTFVDPIEESRAQK
ncbi:MAG: hypothetical protein UT95_C0061G0002 [Candidatus Curtissbacteria bacterium GW2011_GWB1_40_28]|nr:MAG: hypothetical protein UT95_C0061G0002 [Candidatus Curtissbacteria bacterium GW2011_GWB1_40_28]